MTVINIQSERIFVHIHATQLTVASEVILIYLTNYALMWRGEATIVEWRIAFNWQCGGIVDWRFSRPNISKNTVLSQGDRLLLQS